MFFHDRLAMRFNYSHYTQQIARNDSTREKPLNWGIVTVPVDPAYPNRTDYMQLLDLFSINADSSNKSLAWEFIKFVNSEEMAKALSKTYDGSLSVRPAYINDKSGNKLDAFYAFTEKRHNSRRNTNLPSGFKIYSIVNTIMSRVLTDEYTLDEAIQKIQEVGNEQLNKAYEKQKLDKASAK